MSYTAFIVENMRDGKPYSPPSYAIFEVHTAESGNPTTIRSPFCSVEEAIQRELDIAFYMGLTREDIVIYTTEGIEVYERKP